MQEHERREYVCLACGWRKSIPEAWADSKPRKCSGKKCKTNFQAEPEKLAFHTLNKKVKVESESKPVESESKPTKKYKKKS